MPVHKACVYKSSVENELKVHMIWTDDSSSGCCAKWHSSKDHVCWFSSSSESMSLSFSQPSFSGKRSSMSFWYRINGSYDTSANFRILAPRVSRVNFFFLRVFLSRLARRTKRKRDNSWSTSTLFQNAIPPLCRV